MSKFTKLINNPRMFVEDALRNKFGDAYKKSEYMLRYIDEFMNEKKLKDVNAANLLVNQPVNGATVETVAAAPKSAPADLLPAWFNDQPNPIITAAVREDREVFLYVPWIVEHTNTLIEAIRAEDYDLIAFDFANDIPTYRKDILRYARENPELYRKMILKKLIPINKHITGFIFTFDWAPVMKIISSVCEELGIKRILVPHESVFVDRTKYYVDITSKASMPSSDVVLAWGGLQKEIFVERGYPAERIVEVGAPKFDKYVDYKPVLSREQFCKVFGLDPRKKVILFASQPLDSQLDKKVALMQQRRAIVDLIDVSAEIDAQLLIRCPPSKDAILNMETRRKISSVKNVAVDHAECYLVSPEEALYHSDLVTSINSTMLFEGVLMGRPALSMKYVEFEQLWENVGIPAVRDVEELRLSLEDVIANWRPREEGLQWAADNLSNGKFDGKAGLRVKGYLTELVKNPDSLGMRLSSIDRVLAKQTDSKIDIIGIPSLSSTVNTTQKYLLELLNANTRVQTEDGLDNPPQIASVDIFAQWGITFKERKIKQAEAQKALGRSYLIIEDGFIRSMDIGLSGEPTLSVILDDLTAYYDATMPSRLETLIQEEGELGNAEKLRARNAIDAIVKNRVSKYNHAPDLPLKLGDPGRPKILLIDQRFGDQSVESGLADENAFSDMLYDAIKHYSEYDIIIKQHPDAIKGGKSSYFSAERLEPMLKTFKNIYPVTLDVNPYSLFDVVDKVFVVTSGMGFEALMAGKAVHCYGAPYYSGWGLTVDKISLPRRTASASLEKVFYNAFIRLSRYYSPDLNRACEVEELVDYIATHRKK